MLSNKPFETPVVAKNSSLLREDSSKIDEVDGEEGMDGWKDGERLLVLLCCFVAKEFSENSPPRTLSLANQALLQHNLSTTRCHSIHLLKAIMASGAVGHSKTASP